MGDTFDEAYAWGRDRAQAGKQRKQAMSDADLESHLETYGHAIEGLTQKLGTVAPGSPEHTQTQSDLAKAIQDRSALLHPDNNPGALQRFGKRIAEKLHMVHPELAQAARIHLTPTPAEPAVPSTISPGMNPAAGPLTTPALPAIPAGTRVTVAPSTDPRVLRAQAEANLIASSVPTYQAPVFNAEETHDAARVKAGLDPRATVEKPEQHAFKTQAITLSDGRNITAQQDTKTGEWSDLNGDPLDKSLLSGAMASPKPVSAPKVGSFGDFMMAGYGAHPTAQQYADGRRRWAQSVAGTTHGTHDIQVPQPDGTIKLVTVETSSTKSYGGGGAPLPATRADGTPSVSTPPQAAPAVSTTGTTKPMAVRSRPDATPASLRSKAVKPPSVTRTPSPQKSSTGRVVGGKQLPQATKALEAVDQAEGAYRDVKQAAADPTPLGDKGIVLAWLRGRVNRVTATEIASVSSLGGAKFALENNVARITEGKMSTAQRKWFLKSAEDNYTNAKAVASKYSGAPAASDLGQSPAPAQDDMVMATIPGVGTKPIHRSQVDAFKKKYPNGTVK